MRQGSDEWLEMRRSYLGASDAPIIMGVSPYATPLQLWERKKGLSPEQKQTPAMRAGHETEEETRQEYERQTGHHVFPTVVFHEDIPWMMASMDGLSLDRKEAVEIKLNNRKNHEMAKNGDIPPEHYPQLQHQMEVCNLSWISYFSRCQNDYALIRCSRDNNYIEKLLENERQFWECISTDTPPPPTARDHETRTDSDWASLAEEFREADARYQAAKSRRESLKRALIGLSGDRSSQGSGICLSRVYRPGPISYGEIDVLKQVDLEKYRKEGRYVWRVRRVDGNDTIGPV